MISFMPNECDEDGWALSEVKLSAHPSTFQLLLEQLVDLCVGIVQSVNSGLA